MADNQLLVCVRPLGVSALDEPMPVNVSHEPGDVALRLLGDVLDDRDQPLEAARRRYREILHTTTQLPMAPMHDAIRNYPWGIGSLSWEAHREFSNIDPPGELPLLR